MSRPSDIVKFVVKSGISGVLRNVKKACYVKVASLHTEFAPSAEPIPFEKRAEGNFQTIRPGQVWDKNAYGCAWFHFTGKVPESCKGKKIAVLISNSAEGCVFDQNGNPKRGISSTYTFVEFAQPTIGKRYVDIAECAEGGEEIDLWMDAGNNHRPDEFCKCVKLKQADIVIVNDEAKSVFYDMEALLYQRNVTPATDAKYASIDKALKAAAAAVRSKSGSEGYAEAKKILRAEMANGEDSPYTFYATGHAHLDLAWLWPIRETQRKATRTFVNQVCNMERYPDYVFGASQPQQFEWMEQQHPELFERLKAMVAKGQLEVQGGMWVECDTNVVSGESLIRQNVYGKSFWKEKFGKEMRMCWLPDVFGFSGNLPQILKKCGMDYFETIKLSWNEHNKFPHRAFIWEGIDDSSVIVHMPPDETYNSEGNAWSLANAIRNFPERDKIKNIGLLYGVGDGGGGPGEAHIELLERERNMKGLPKVVLSPAIDLFDKLAEQKDELVRHKGELYLEKHQGTYTTQSKNKYFNRKIEFALHNTEFLCALAEKKGMEYPKAALDKIWKEMLLYQFHDIIPGSSINRVYDESVARYEKMMEELLSMQTAALAALAEGKRALTAVNPTGYRVRDLIFREDKWYEADVPPYGSALLKPYTETKELKGDKNSIENNIFVVKFDNYGNIKSLFDKRTKKEFCGLYLNKLNVYKDKRLHYNAWDIDINYTKLVPAEFKLIDSNVKVSEGAVVRENMYKYNKSSISQKVILTAGKPIVDFVTTIDWQETHKMLRADFRPAVFADEVTCDIQMGNLKRSTKNADKYEKAQFEICAHKWVDVSNKGEGFSILTESKFGWRVKEGLMSLNVLRSPMWPAKNADKGMHTIRYALYPHNGDYNDANTQREGYAYNNKLIITEDAAEIDSLVTSSNPHVVVETVKRAENGEGLIVRVYEDSGKTNEAEIKVAGVSATVEETDLLENVIGQADLASLTFKPFEIRTFLVK